MIYSTIIWESIYQNKIQQWISKNRNCSTNNVNTTKEISYGIDVFACLEPWHAV